MKNNPLSRLDEDSETRQALLPHCRLVAGEIWNDPEGKHCVACIDATDRSQVANLMASKLVTLAIHDPPYNLVAFDRRAVGSFTEWCEQWVQLTDSYLAADASLYVWLGADQNANFQPLPQFMLMMERLNLFTSRSFITMRNQRGYGTQKNWMAVRQELLFYTKGSPYFEVQYTEIPKILRGYYKDVAGEMTENLERSKSENIRPGNVWVDVQQVFYRMEENVSGCYAQKPVKAIERIVSASSRKEDTVLDFFSHSGSTLLACERLRRKCVTADIDPVYCEITIRRLENFRKTGRLGWQNGHAFEDVLGRDEANQEAINGTVPQKALRDGRLF